VSDFTKNYESILENYGCIKTTRREFYPKNFNLSEEFVNSFKKEYKRLVGEGVHPRRALQRINKALLFHARD
jgi:hypothetical protein